MVHDSLKNLQFDRRLQHRRGWINEEAFEAHLASLPDISDKAEQVAAEPGTSQGSDAAGPGGGEA